LRCRGTPGAEITTVPMKNAMSALDRFLILPVHPHIMI